MTPLCRSSLVVLSLAFLSATSASAQETGQPRGQVLETRDWLQRDTSYAEGKQDPPGVLNQHNLKNLRQLAKRLSSDNKWLTDDVLKGLDMMSVRLEDVFTGAPAFIEVEGQLYRIALEKVGPAWKDFDPQSSKFLIFLNHEVYDGLGENYALGFERGQERVIAQDEIETTAALGLTLQGITPDESPKDKARVAAIESPIRLGKARPNLRSPKDRVLGSMLKNITEANTSCSPVAAPTSCSNGVPVCASGTATPYFVLSSLTIKTDHEGAFKGNPEIELFPFRINPSSPIGGSSDVRTKWIFSGRTVTDLAGRSVYLPNVQNTNQWYYVNGGLALYPSLLSNEYVSTLVENDDTTGQLEIDRNKNNPIKRPREAYIQLWPFDYLDFLIDVARFIYTLGFLDDSDDLYVESLAVNNNLFCTEGVGQYFPYNFTLTGSEWDMQGHFACIDPACVPDPCAGDPCCGDPCCGDPFCGGGGCGYNGQICQ